MRGESAGRSVVRKWMPVARRGATRRIVQAGAGVAVVLVLCVRVVMAAFVIDAVGLTPAAAPVGVATQVVITAAISEPSVLANGVNLQRLDSAGRVVAILGLLRDDGAEGDNVAGDRIFTYRMTVFETTPGQLRLRVSAAFQGRVLRAFSQVMLLNVTGATATGITIASPADLAYLNTPVINVTGTVGDAAAGVTVNGIPATLTQNAYTVSVPLVEGSNTLTAVASNSGGTTSTASVRVTLDTTPPRVTVESPANGAETTEPTTTVAGTVNDIVVGTVNSQQAEVTVNGVAAQVANRSFLAASVPLVQGLNLIQVVGRDRAGNQATTQVNVTRIAPRGPFIRIVSGNNQSGPVSSPLAAPLVVQLDNGVGLPVPNTAVVFRVADNNAQVAAGTGPFGASVVAMTDQQGRAQVRARLGSRSGAGGNRVEAAATGFEGVAAFVATGVPSAAQMIIVDSGNNQTGALGEKLAQPLLAVVTDAGFNRIGGVPVNFVVKGGGGSFDGKPSLTVNTDPDGRAAASLRLGTEPGIDNNLVEASFAGNPGLPAAFVATAKSPGNAADTRISGVVLDNSNDPIKGVTVRLFQTHQGNNNNTPVPIGTPVVTNDNGTFEIHPAPVGFFKLMADGSTVEPARGAFPTLEYDLVTVAGQNNTLGMPIYLPLLDVSSQLCVDENTGGTLTLDQIPGFALTVLPGSATFPGGARSGCVTVSAVNPDKVPMAPGFGQQPRFIVTIQPVGTVFNPPAPITMPNVDGLLPGQVTELYSYDHDLSAFTAIGTGTVTPDGLLVRSDPGVGILKAGWHCGGNPSSTGSAASLSLTTVPTEVKVHVGDDFTITASGSPPRDGTYIWQAPAGPQAAYKTPPPSCNNASSCTATLEAKQAGETTVTVCFKCTTTNQQICKNVKVKVWAVESVVFEAIDSPLDANPNAGGGQRIFPEKQTETDTVDRKKVRVKAKITPAEANLQVFFKSFDVDDPSSDVAPVDPNGAAGDDNRGAPKAGTLNMTSAMTDAAGVATVELTMPMQPGDNVKAAASGKQAYINGLVVDGVGLKDSTGAALPTTKGKLTDLLTVWRKVHVEVDSMGVVTGNQVTGNITGLLPAGAGTGTATGVTVDNSLDDGSPDLDDGAPQNGRFERGRLTVAGVNVLTPVDGNGNTRIARAAGMNITSTPLPFTAIDNDLFGNSTMSGTLTQIVQVGGKYVLRLNVTANSETPIDWPDFIGGTISVGGGPAMAIDDSFAALNSLEVAALRIPYSLVDDDALTGDVPDLDTSGLAAVYAPAYVVPVADTGKNTPAATFHLNSSTADLAAHINASKGVALSTNDYWAVTALAAYQVAAGPGGIDTGDNDPDSEGTDRAWADSNVQGVLFGMESVRDWIATPSPLGGNSTDPASAGRQSRTQEILSHEIGHLFGLDHADGNVTAADPAGGVMNPSCCPPDNPAMGTRGASTFTQTSLAKIRAKTKPGI